MRLWRSRYAFGSIYAYGVRYRASHSICLLRKRADNQWLPLQANLNQHRRDEKGESARSPFFFSAENVSKSETDGERLIHTVHIKIVKFAHSLLQALFVYRAHLFKQYYRIF